MKKSTKKKRKKKRFFSVKTLFLLLSAGLILSLGYYLFFPDVSELKKHNPPKTAFMEYREEQWADEGKNMKIRQKWVPLSHISPYLIKAVLIGEDDKFWKHEGFDFDALQKAVEKDIKAGKFKAGGSTISQQLAKNLFLSPSKNPMRKIKEAILTWRMERDLSKKRILELYLNVAEWGEGIFGIEAAARHYYHKPAASLSPEEASRLASVLPNPIKFNPLGKSRYVEKRSRIIYSIMVRRGIVLPVYEEVTEEEPGEKDGEERVQPKEETSGEEPQKEMAPEGEGK
ncbi:MAG: monofunctional biosynthetic peptidoglycan transglycosylase [Nitrospirales bacterium]|nr:monofunctional biosynthetic peptidoglycan transglycosylase [Nitrospirales bacterium]